MWVRRAIFVMNHHCTKIMTPNNFLKRVLIALPSFLLCLLLPAQVELKNFTGGKLTGTHEAELVFGNQQILYIDFYSENSFRMFYSPHGDKPHDPVAKPPAKILADNPRKPLGALQFSESGNEISIQSKKIKLIVEKKSGILTAFNLAINKQAFRLNKPIFVENDKANIALSEGTDEYYYGGGVQNGRFSHKGKAISIENQNSWTDGGVASPVPFYWSTAGYGLLWHTFKPGRYDFGLKERGTVRLFHNDSYLDVFFMISQEPVQLLQDYYQLTGQALLLPKFGFYQGHLNAYNRDYWKEDTTGKRGIRFEDGKYYTESQKDNGGIRESLNGEKNNYQFSARAVIDRYRQHDMPLGWILPNDGYGAGYGQTSTLDSNIQNLKSFGDYARQNGVEIGLWTQSDLHPKQGISALLQRDIVKEVRDAGVRVLKTDVAWVGAGYSFGLNGVADAASVFAEYGSGARPFIISLDGWAGTQRYAGVWSGDQTGGNWEYIRFHIPTYIGAGLSGMPNITSDMDGIFGGKNLPVNVRDFQWKTFTPMQLNMDGWGTNEKYPHALGEPATSINRLYLKLKSELLPYSYSIARQAVNGLPMIRAMFLEDPNEFTLGTATQYQYMYGPSFLVAPVYQNTAADAQGNDIRNNIYLPPGSWVDYFTGEEYEGGKVINSFSVPLWKIPVFVKAGAIIPLANANNNVSEIDIKHRIYEFYPKGNTSFTEYDDDGVSQEYLSGKYTTTQIESKEANNKAELIIHPTVGVFKNFTHIKTTEFRVNAPILPNHIEAKINAKKIKLKQVYTEAEYNSGENVWIYLQPEFKRYATKGSDFSQKIIKRNAQLWVKLEPGDVSRTTLTLSIKKFRQEPKHKTTLRSEGPEKPIAEMKEENRHAFSLLPSWKAVPGADYYEIEFNGMLYTLIRDTTFLFEDLQPETSYRFKIRAKNITESPWTVIETKTLANPLQDAIHGLTARVSVRNQPGEGIANLFDFDEANIWHTRWDAPAVPFNMIINLNSISQIEKLQYLPRTGAGNGTWLKGNISYSIDKANWLQAGTFTWKRDDKVKEFSFAEKPVTRYLKIEVSEAVGNFGSGRELYVYRVSGTESQLPGDINHDGLIDQNDLTSYMNYTGLRQGDADFEGYISKGDLNRNGVIDAYDISNVATALEGGAWEESQDTMSGKILLQNDKANYSKGDTMHITVSSAGFSLVNALGFALPYNTADYEYAGIQAIHTGNLENFTRDRLHTDGNKVLYPVFVNIGDRQTLSGSDKLFVIRFVAKRNLTFGLKAKDGLLVDKRLIQLKF